MTNVNWETAPKLEAAHPPMGLTEKRSAGLSGASGTEHWH